MMRALGKSARLNTVEGVRMKIRRGNSCFSKCSPWMSCKKYGDTLKFVKIVGSRVSLQTYHIRTCILGRPQIIGLYFEVVEHLPSNLEALSSNPSTVKKMYIYLYIPQGLLTQYF
jgi:hypothetical protein